MMRKMLLAAALSVTAMTAHADYQCSVTPRDDVIVSGTAHFNSLSLLNVKVVRHPRH